MKFRTVIIGAIGVAAVLLLFLLNEPEDEELNGYQEVTDVETEAENPAIEPEQLADVPLAPQSVEPPASPKADLLASVRFSEPLETDRAHPHQLGSWLGALDPKPVDWPPLASEQWLVELAMPDGELYTLQFHQSKTLGDRKGIFMGQVAEQPGSQVLISYVGDAIAGTIRIPSSGQAWEIRNKGNAVQEFEKVDLHQLKGCAVCKFEE